ncbi:MAG: right-handed parallel beta-helix repeat-containing protein [Deltaproteobacteria bacterium]|nr:right-handed parallel beta-helix repeat-containing protein [Deltaproteobacteria bacterium]
MRFSLVFLLCLTISGAASADDGVLEINQSCAVNTGCFAGDTAGFPVTITTTGSYRLTATLTLPNENTNGIEISANSVSLDLNGFEIAGPVACQSRPVSCTPSSGTGSAVDSSGFTGTTVANGRIRGMGFRGLDLSAYAIVEGVALTSNRAQQIVVGAGSIVRNNIASFGGNTGISAGAGAVVTGNTANNHGNAGISAGSGSTVAGNSAYLNGSDGIIVSSGSTVVGNLVYANLGDGIQTTSSSMVQRNTIRENALFGIRNVSALSPTAYRNNTIYLNQTGEVEDGVDLGGNYCAPACP